jgi:hypothetical protein
MKDVWNLPEFVKFEYRDHPRENAHRGGGKRFPGHPKADVS